ncbi:unnamed protein product [Euphydryas editha]|uniref:ZZ-type domain-containing protein n=1 Tax=Euphydryas editha TaxID=104508 RepID=A0AAU9TSQ0_EUPED|nr:unnamed protein product [Euphydryas editha]
MTASRVCACDSLCAACGTPLVQVLKFKCSKCNVFFCENCYLYDKDLTKVPGHKKTHLVQEITEGEIKPPECLSFMKGMKRFFFCTKKKKKSSKKIRKNIDKPSNSGSIRLKEKPAMFTSTVGKASGNKNNPAVTLQDVITQLENENKAIKDLTEQLEAVVKNDNIDLKAKVDEHYKQISTQINRLKMLKDNLLNTQNLPSESENDKNERPQAFDLFSPIPVVEEKSKVTENIKNQPRVLSMDSGNFSVTSKPDSQNLLTMSGDALKPVVVHATSDSISTVSMNDMSNWYNETETTSRPTVGNLSSTEQRYAADLASVANGNRKVRDLNADLDAVLDRLQQILTHNFAMDDSCFDNTQLRETANEMEGLLGSLIRGVEQRATLSAKGLV